MKTKFQLTTVLKEELEDKRLTESQTVTKAGDHSLSNRDEKVGVSVGISSEGLPSREATGYEVTKN